MTYKGLFDTKEIKEEAASPKYDPFGSAAEPKQMDQQLHDEVKKW